MSVFVSKVWGCVSMMFAGVLSLSRLSQFVWLFCAWIWVVWWDSVWVICRIWLIRMVTFWCTILVE